MSATSQAKKKQQLLVSQCFSGRILFSTSLMISTLPHAGRQAFGVSALLLWAWQKQPFIHSFGLMRIERQSKHVLTLSG